jgi:hypothetical protein
MNSSEPDGDIARELFTLTSPDVIRVHATSGESDKSHVVWSVGYAPEKESETDARVIFGTLHAAGPNAFGDVVVSAMLIDTSKDAYAEADIEAVLAQSDAIETLYDFAKANLRPVLAVVDADIRLPYTSPGLELTALERIEESETATLEND